MKKTKPWSGDIVDWQLSQNPVLIRLTVSEEMGLTNYDRADDGCPRDEAQSRNKNVLLSKM